MKQLILFLGTLLPTAIAAQELHTFSNGEVADAEKINENFQYVLENATNSGGCSAEQDGSNVVITCADGTSGVLASEGTVIVYPEGGIVGELPKVEYNAGQIVLIDADEVVLGSVVSNSDKCYVIRLRDFDVSRTARLCNNTAEESVRLSGGHYSAFFLEIDCKGMPFFDREGWILELADGFWIVPWPLPQSDTLLLKSRRLGATSFSVSPGECVNEEIVKLVRPMVTYTPAPELLNAAYPVRLEQLP